MIILLFYFGLTLFVVGYAWVLAEAFKMSMVWGMAVLLPPLALVFGVWHVREQWRPTALMFAGLVASIGIMPAIG